MKALIKPVPPKCDPRDEAGVPLLCYMVELAWYYLRRLWQNWR